MFNVNKVHFKCIKKNSIIMQEINNGDVVIGLKSMGNFYYGVL